MIHITIHSLNNCVFCDKAKEFLKERNIGYKEITYNKGRDTDLIMELVEVTKQTSFPQIYIDGEFIGGYEQLVNYNFPISFDEEF